MLETETKTPVEALVAAYIETRNSIQELEAAHEENLRTLKEKMEELSNKLLDVCNQNDADSIRTKAGTISRRITTRYWTTDWEQMHKFIKENDAFYLMEQRIHNGNMRQFLHENPDLYPLGLQADSKFTVQVRKPTAR